MICVKAMRPADRLPLPAFFILSFFWFFPLLSGQVRRPYEEGNLSISIKGETVGYEVYTWEEGPAGYRLSVEGRLTKPVPVEIESLTIELDPHFIPVRYRFRGTMSGVLQDMTCVISDGLVESTIRVAGQEQKTSTQIRRDALLLPNPVWAPYLVIGKKFGCGLEEKKELSGYIIPQMEIPVFVEAAEENPCLLLVQVGGATVELEIDDGGRLKRLRFPSQDIEVVSDRYSLLF